VISAAKKYKSGKKHLKQEIDRLSKEELTEKVDTSGRGEEVGKGCERVNMVQILCIHIWKWKNETC
jgi:hypothetical protein